MSSVITRRDFLTAFGVGVTGTVVLAHTPAARFFAPQTPVDVALTDVDLMNIWRAVLNHLPHPTDARYPQALGMLRSIGFFTGPASAV